MHHDRFARRHECQTRNVVNLPVCVRRVQILKLQFVCRKMCSEIRYSSNHFAQAHSGVLVKCLTEVSALQVGVD